MPSRRIHAAEIGEVLAIRDRGEAPCAHVAELIDHRRREGDRRIAELRATRGTLAELAERSGQLDPDDCDGFCYIIERTAQAG